MSKSKIMAPTKLLYIIILGLVCMFTALVFMVSDMSKNFRLTLRQGIETKLINIDEWPESQTFDAMYILGGNQKAQKYKFEVASKIHSQRTCQKIYFMSTEGFTEFNTKLSRNLTNDEWSYIKMEAVGIPSSDVTAIAMDEGMFGTMTEAENVAKLAIQGKYKSLLIVAAPYHSKRVRLSFEHFLKNMDVQIIIIGSGEPKYLRSLTVEWVKLKLYEVLLLVG